MGKKLLVKQLIDDIDKQMIIDTFDLLPCKWAQTATLWQTIVDLFFFRRNILKVFKDKTHKQMLNLKKTWSQNYITFDSMLTLPHFQACM